MSKQHAGALCACKSSVTATYWWL